jgi:hypothetical protein
MRKMGAKTMIRPKKLAEIEVLLVNFEPRRILKPVKVRSFL